MIELGGIKVNDLPAKASTKVRRGDVIDVVLPAPAIRTIEPQAIPLQVVYEDDDLIVIDKQANLVVHPARSHQSGTLLNALAHHFRLHAEQDGGSPDVEKIARDVFERLRQRLRIEWERRNRY